MADIDLIGGDPESNSSECSAVFVDPHRGLPPVRQDRH